MDVLPGRGVTRIRHQPLVGGDQRCVGSPNPGRENSGAVRAQPGEAKTPATATQIGTYERVQIDIPDGAGERKGFPTRCSAGAGGFGRRRAKGGVNTEPRSAKREEERC